MHTIILSKLKTTLHFSFPGLNNNTIAINQNHSCTAHISSFLHVDALIHVHHSLAYNQSTPSCYLCVTVSNGS